MKTFEMMHLLDCNSTANKHVLLEWNIDFSLISTVRSSSVQSKELFTPHDLRDADE